MNSHWRIGVGIIWGILIIPFGWSILIGFGIAAANGVSSLDIQTVTFLTLPLILLISCIGEIISGMGKPSKNKTAASEIFVVLPVLHILLVLAFLFL